MSAAATVSAIRLDGEPTRVHVVIVGCGYVGLELGRRLTPTHRVTGVRRSADGLEAVEDAGLEAYHADATDPTDLHGLPSADAVVYAASARGEDDARETYVEGLRTVVDHFGERRDPPGRLVYTSSTGVYGDHGGDWVDETTPIEPATDREELLREAERVARGRGAAGVDRTVVRFGGVYGPDRSPVERYLDGPIAPGHVNLVHRDDAAGAVAHLLETGRGAGSVLNVVDDEPADRVELARWLADRRGVDPPSIADDARESARAAADKRVANDRLHDLGYEFDYPTYREGLTAGMAGADGSR